MKTLLFGLGEIGFQTLSAILSSRHPIVGVVTKPGSAAASTKLGRLCRRCNVPLMTPDTPVEPQVFALCEAQSVELIVVAGYHRRISREVLSFPPFGVLNLHDSLLPKYRGPNATRWVLINGEQFTGATVHLMTAEFDSGPILMQERVAIEANDNSATLFQKISRVGARLVVTVMDGFDAGDLVITAQSDERASYFSYPTPDDMKIDWQQPGEKICALVRGLSPEPGAMARVRGVEVRIRQARVCSNTTRAVPGTVIRAGDSSLQIATGLHDVEITDMGCGTHALHRFWGGTFLEGELFH